MLDLPVVRNDDWMPPPDDCFCSSNLSWECITVDMASGKRQRWIVVIHGIAVVRRHQRET